GAFQTRRFMYRARPHRAHLGAGLPQGNPYRLTVRAAEVAQHALPAQGQHAAHPVDAIKLEAVSRLFHHAPDIRRSERRIELTLEENMVHAGVMACSAGACCAGACSVRAYSAMAASACRRAQAATPCWHNADMAANSAAITGASAAARAARYRATCATSISVGRCSSSAQSKASRARIAADSQRPHSRSTMGARDWV